VQARAGLLWEATNAHTEVIATHEAKLQADIAAAWEIQRVKEVIARQAHKEATDLKKKLEDVEQKEKDAAADLQAVVEGEPPTLPYADSICFARSRY
jgi:seryl-tRNA synthetase